MGERISQLENEKESLQAEKADWAASPEARQFALQLLGLPDSARSRTCPLNELAELSRLRLSRVYRAAVESLFAELGIKMEPWPEMHQDEATWDDDVARFLETQFGKLVDRVEFIVEDLDKLTESFDKLMAQNAVVRRAFLLEALRDDMGLPPPQDRQ